MLNQDVGGARPTSWYRDIGTAQWMALALAGLGWAFESYDSFLLSLTLPAIAREFSLSPTQTGALLSVTVAGQIIGGIVFGGVSDRLGRVRTALLCVTIYSVFSGLIATAHSSSMLAVLRFAGALGMGGTWTAGATLIVETWPARWRGRGGALMQMGLPIGAILAIGLSGLVAALTGGLENRGWRLLFLIGVLPAVILFFVARRTPESPMWLQRRATREKRDAEGTASLVTLPPWRNALLAFAFVFFLQYVYWGVFTWTPTYLVSARRFTFLRSLPYVLALQLGALAGFLLFAALVDVFGRRPLFLSYIVVGIAGLVGYVAGPTSTLFFAMFFTGLSVTGIFGGLGPFIAEMLGDVRSRGFLMGLVYNGGRLGGLLAPIVIGVLASGAAGIAAGFSTTVVAFTLAFVVVLFAPETRRHVLN